ncbi:SpoIIE family protein phosphatase [Gracilibacillus alcaliphilus]|uniref:SpoIIE family protein phosphatase n=1 Tax=Gracilibacillus alcaliphilus TaxID=1401441 RepID=UPI00195D08B5|nr:SpoIIE family protein phosphatase [Gracilibacillus alcaliphilus]MBM7679297.1 negative regulator of sigma-B (phosphoserine phosphatase) [Gracilibacillus alcaliphilus]
MGHGECVEISTFQKPKQGNFFCGDSYYYKEFPDRFICALADGLGSGECAQESSRIVMDVIKRNEHDSVTEMMKKSNQKLLGKRGAVLGVLQLDFVNKRYVYSSIGNIGLMIVTANSIKKRNIPQSGYLSGYDRPYREMADDLEDNMIFIMFSDGVTAKELATPHFLEKEVQRITDTYANFYQNSLDDDTTLIAMKYNPKS